MVLPARIVLASANPKKVAELDRILRDLTVVTPEGRAVELVPRPEGLPEVPEDADSFVGNAELKAAALASWTGEAALADDSGLLVDALDGAPGVHSARYAGESANDADNVARLLAELERVGAMDPSSRTARFHCVIVLRAADGEQVVADGSVEGHIALEPVGDAGFGYDPVFVPVEGDGRTFAQMSADEKQSISHRGRALRSLAAQLSTA